MVDLYLIVKMNKYIFNYRYSKFIDTFGARPAGTDNLEKAIDYMIDLTTKNGLNDISTEEVKVILMHT